MEEKKEERKKTNYLGVIVAIIAFIVAFGVFYQLTKTATTSLVTETATPTDFVSEYKTNFTAACVKNFLEETPDNDMANKYCDCIVNKMIDKYTEQELRDMEKAFEITDEIQQLMNECISS